MQSFMFYQWILHITTFPENKLHQLSSAVHKSYPWYHCFIKTAVPITVVQKLNK